MDERVDLGALRLDDIRRAQLVAAIMERAASEVPDPAAPDPLRREAIDVNPMVILSEWLRPALAAAAVVVLISGSLLALTLDAPGPSVGLTDVLAVPRPANEWLVGERAPTISDLLIAMESEAR
jgi:hypothetical protein